MSRKLVAMAAVLTALVPFLSACGGGGSSNAAKPLPTTAPTLTVPGVAKTPTVDNSATKTTTTDTTTSSTTTTTATPAPAASAPSNPSTPSGGAASPQTGGAAPTPTTTTPAPAPSSPAGKFEQFCKENPGAC